MPADRSLSPVHRHGHSLLAAAPAAARARRPERGAPVRRRAQRRPRSSAPTAGRRARPPPTPGPSRSRSPDFAFIAVDVQAKVGDVIAFTNNDTAAHTAPSTTTPACTTDTLQTARRAPYVLGAGHVPVPLQDPSGHDTGRSRSLTSAAGSGRALREEHRGAGRQVDRLGVGRPASANQARNCSREASAVPWYSSSSWTPAMSSPWRVRNSSGSTAAASPARGAGRPVEAPPTPRSDRGASCELVERVLEVGEVVLARVAGLVALPWRISIRSASPASATVARARATESASNSTPTSSRSGNRRAIATSQRPPPQWTSTTRPPRDRSADELGQRREDLLEEDRDVLAGQALDRGPVAVGPVARSASPVRKKSTIPPQSIEATDAWTNWPPR